MILVYRPFDFAYLSHFSHVSIPSCFLFLICRPFLFISSTYLIPSFLHHSPIFLLLIHCFSSLLSAVSISFLTYLTTLRYLSYVSLLFLPAHRLLILLLMPCPPPYIWPLPISCLFYFSLSDLPIICFSLPTFKLPLHILFLFSSSNFLSYVLLLSSIHLTASFIYPFSRLPVSFFFFFSFCHLNPSTHFFFYLNVIQSS